MVPRLQKIDTIVADQVNNAVFLDGESKTMIAAGNPRDLLANSRDPRVIRFLTRGEKRKQT